MKRIICLILIILSMLICVACAKVDISSIEDNLIIEMQKSIDDNLEKFGNDDNLIDYQNSIYGDLEHIEKDEIDVQIIENKDGYIVKVVFNYYYPSLLETSKGKYEQHVYKIQVPKDINIKDFNIDEIIKNKDIIVKNEHIEIYGTYQRSYEYVIDRNIADGDSKIYASKNTLKRYLLWDLGFINVEIEE